MEYRYPSRREFSLGFSRSRGVVEENINGEGRTDESRVSTRRPPVSSILPPSHLSCASLCCRHRLQSELTRFLPRCMLTDCQIASAICSSRNLLWIRRLPRQDRQGRWSQGSLEGIWTCYGTSVSFCRPLSLSSSDLLFPLLTSLSLPSLFQFPCQ